MRRVFNGLGRGVAAVAVIVALSLSVQAAGREDRDRDRTHPIIKVIKKVVKALGDGLTIPKP